MALRCLSCRTSRLQAFKRQVARVKRSLFLEKLESREAPGSALVLPFSILGGEAVAAAAQRAGLFENDPQSLDAKPARERVRHGQQRATSSPAAVLRGAESPESMKSLATTSYASPWVAYAQIIHARNAASRSSRPTTEDLFPSALLVSHGEVLSAGEAGQQPSTAADVATLGHPNNSLETGASSSASVDTSVPDSPYAAGTMRPFEAGTTANSFGSTRSSQVASESGGELSLQWREVVPSGLTANASVALPTDTSSSNPAPENVAGNSGDTTLDTPSDTPATRLRDVRVRRVGPQSEMLLVTGTLDAPELMTPAGWTVEVLDETGQHRLASAPVAQSGINQPFELAVREHVDDSARVVIRLVDANQNIVNTSGLQAVLRGTDSDGDGVNDEVESRRLGSGDGNRDGLSDSGQASVATLLSAQSGEPTWLTLDAHGQGLRSTRGLPAPADIVSGARLPYGVVAFEIGGLTPGASTTVDVWLPADAEVDTYLKLDPQNGQYAPFLFDGTTGAVFSGNHVTLHLVDGGRGDADGLANGVIVDPGGPGALVGTVTLPFTGSGGLDGWTFAQSGGTTTPGSVTVDVSGNNNFIDLKEGDSFRTSLSRVVTIPADPVELYFDYELTFDGDSSGFIHDAFEVALLDEAGQSPVPTFRAGRDAFVNHTETQSVGLGTTTTVTNGRVSLDISTLPVGKQYTLVLRLINEDAYVTSGVSDIDTTLRIFAYKPDNLPPVLTNDTVNAVEDTTLVFSASTLLTNDAPGPLHESYQTLTVTSVGSISNPAAGTVTLASGQITYTPAAQFNGSFMFQYTATDNGTTNGQPAPLSATATVTVNVAEVNDAPTAGADALSTMQNQAITIPFSQLLANDGVGPTNESSQTLTITAVGTPAHGTTTLNTTAKTITYTPTSGYNGADSFSYTVRDDGTSQGAADYKTANGTVSVSVLPATITFSLSSTSGAEGASVALSGYYYNATFAGPYTAIVYWGDGLTSNATVNHSGTSGTVSANHIYADNKAYTPRVELFAAGVARAQASTTATITNVAPTLSATWSAENVSSVMHIALTGSFTDPGFTRAIAGTIEDFDVTVSWGDGTTTNLDPSITQGSDGVLTTGSFNVLHNYAPGKVYTATVTVVDDDGGQASKTFTYGIACLSIDVARTINLTSEGNIPVKILCNSVDFDFSAIDATSLRFGPGGAKETDLRVTGGSDNMRMSHFSVQEAAIRPWDTVAYLTGKFTNGTYFVGMDRISLSASSQGNPPAPIDPTGAKFYVTDTLGNVNVRYTTAGDPLSAYPLDRSVAYTSPKDKGGVDINPIGQTIDADYHLYTLGSSHQIAKSRTDGTLIGTIRAYGLDKPQGIATNGTDIWVVDAGLKKVVKYDKLALSDSDFTLGIASSSFSLHADNQNPTGITTTTGDYLWVVDEVRDEVFVYQPNGTLDGRWTLGSDNIDPSDLTRSLTDSAVIWVLDRADGAIYKYANGKNLRSGQGTISQTYTLAQNNSMPEGIADPAGGGTSTESGLGGGTAPPTVNIEEEGAGSYAWYFNESLEPALTTRVTALDVARSVSSRSDLVASASYVSVPSFGRPNAVSTAPISSFPRNGASYAILSTGDSLQVNDPGTYSATDRDGASTRGGAAYDATVLKIDVNVPSGANYLSFDFQFFSEEYPAFVGTQYDDVFLAELDQNTWTTQNGLVVAPYNFALTRDGTSLRPSTAGVYDFSPNNALGTAFDGGLTLGAGDGSGAATRVLRATTPITAGAHSLYLSIANIGDAKLDSAVLIDNLMIGTSTSTVVAGIREVVGIAAEAAVQTTLAGEDAIISGRVMGDATFDTVAGTVTVNGIPVDVLDAAGNFFARVPVQPGQNEFRVRANPETDIVLTGASLNDLAVVEDLTASIVDTYEGTSFQDGSHRLFADVTLQNDSNFEILGPLYVGVRNISQPFVTVSDADGTTAGGIPYFDISHLLSNGRLAPGAALDSFTLEFFNPDRVPFTYDLVVLGRVNAPPVFVSLPVIEATVGKTYAYDSDAIDPDNDVLTYRLLTGPSGMGFNTSTGAMEWTPSAADVGNHQVVVEVDDAISGTDLQSFVITVRSGTPNRPPVFTSVPISEAFVNMQYTYDSDAIDPDQDVLAYSLVGGNVPTGMAIDSSGIVRWVPRAAHVGTHHVTIRATETGLDAQGNPLSKYDEQTFVISVQPQPGNHPPIITSSPQTYFEAAGASTPPQGNVSPQQIVMHFPTAAPQTQSVSLTLPLTNPTTTADIVLIVDESGSMQGEHAWLSDMVTQLDTSLVAAGVTSNRYALIGFGAMNPAAHAFAVGPADSDPLFGTAAQLGTAVGQLVTSGGFEDGYDGLDEALGLTYRTGAARNFILITDEDRDAMRHDLTFTSTLAGLIGANARLDSVVSVVLDDGDPATTCSDYGTGSGTNPNPYTDPLTGTTVVTVTPEGGGGPPSTYTGCVIGVDYRSRAVLLDAQGNYSFVPGGEVIGPWDLTSATVVEDYVEMSLNAKVQGATWALPVLRTGGALAQKFTQAFVQVKTQEIVNGATFYVAIQSSDPNYSFSNPVSPFEVSPSNPTAAFPNLVFNQPSGPRQFDLQFIKEGTGVVLGSIPVMVDTDWDYQVKAVDPDNDPIGYELLTAPAGAVWNETTHQIDWVPPLGEHFFRVRASDQRGGEDIQEFMVRVVQDANQAPVITAAGNYVPPVTAVVGRPYQYAVQASDPDGDVLVYTLGATVPSGMGIDASTGIVTWTPVAGEVTGSSYTIQIQVSDRRGGSDTFSYSLTPQVATPTNTSPTIVSTPDLVVLMDNTWSYDAHAVDGNGDVLTYELTVAPLGMVIDSVTGQAYFQPKFQQVGTHDVVLRVTDAYGGVALQEFTLTVSPPNTPPMFISEPITHATATFPYACPITAIDPDPNAQLTYVFNGPAFLEYDGKVVSGTPLETDIGTHPVSIDVRDGQSVSTLYFELTVHEGLTNSAPVFVTEPPPPGPARAGSPYAYRSLATDANGDAITYFLDSGPAGMEMDASSGLLTWTPSIDHPVTTVPVQISAQDSRGSRTTLTYSLSVTAGVANQDPIIESLPPSSAATVSSSYKYQVQAFDPDGDALSYTLLSNPPGMTMSSSGLIEWTVPADQTGTFHGVKWLVSDRRGGIATQAYVLPVVASTGNLPPVFESVPRRIAMTGSSYKYPVVASDPNGHAITYSMTSSPAASNLSMNTTSGLLSWSSPVTGTYGITITATDSLGATAQQRFQLLVQSNPTNTAPSFTTLPLVANLIVGQSFSFTMRGTDVDGDPLTFGKGTGAPSALNVDTASGVASWTPLTANIGTHTFPVTITDGRSTPVSQTWTLHVSAAPTTNNLPVFVTNANLGNATATVPYTKRIEATDADGDVVWFRLTSGPSGARIDPDTGVLNWTPSGTSASFTVLIEDSRGGTTSQNFSLTVQPSYTTNSAPTFTPATIPATAVANVAYAVQFSGSDPDGDAFTFDLVSPTPAAVRITSEGLLTWTPTDADVSDTPKTIAVRLTDGRGAAFSRSFSVTVGDKRPNSPPVIHSTPRTQVQVGAPYAYQLVASDADGDELQYTIVLPTTLPAGLTFDTTKHQLTGNPTALGATDFLIKVSDGRGGYDAQAFQLVVAAEVDNLPPEITSAPIAFASVGRTYAYNLAAIDPDGDPVTWRLVTAPDGVALDADTGRLRWRPRAEQVGTQTLEVQAVDLYGATHNQVFEVTVRGFNLLPQIVSTPVVSVGINQPYSYTLRVLDPEGDPFTYQVLAPSPAGMEIDSTTGRVTWSTATAGTYTVKLRVEDAANDTLYDEQEYSLVVGTNPLNLPPVITSLAPLVVEVGRVYRYPVTTDDPENGTVTVTTNVSGMTVGTGNVVTWLAPSTPGTQAVTVTATDSGGLVGRQSFVIQVLPRNNLPQIQGSGDQTITAGQTYLYNVDASDADNERLSFAVLNGPDGLTVDRYGRVRWETDADDIGLHYAQIQVSDRFDSVVTTARIQVLEDVSAPQVFVRIDTTPAEPGDYVTILVDAVDNVGVDRLSLTIDGHSIPLDAHGVARILLDETFGPYPRSIVLANPILIVASAWDSAAHTVSQNANLEAYDLTDANDPTVAMTSPSNGATITEPTLIVGTAADYENSVDTLAYYKLELARAGSNQFRQIGYGTDSVTKGTLGTLDPTTLENGLYLLRLTAYDNGNNWDVVEREVLVEGRLKLGNFNVSFLDLTIPVAGIPIEIRRTYDTLRADETGDFGPGWRLDIEKLEVAWENVPGALEGFGGVTPLRKDARLLVTTPDGRVEGFTFEPELERKYFGTLTVWHPRFVPDEGVTSSLGVTDFELTEVSPGEYICFSAGGVSYNPRAEAFGNELVHVTADGRRRVLDATTGAVKAISDHNDNILTLGEDAITSNRGRAVTIERDDRGRITAIVDPKGQQLTYQYDALGRLVSFHDRRQTADNLAGVTFTYHTEAGLENFLDEVLDPNGKVAVKATYSSTSRRLSSLGDALGGQVQMTYVDDLANHSYTQKLYAQDQDPSNPAHTPSQLVFDGQGNLVREQSSSGETTVLAYDPEKNLPTTRQQVVGAVDSPSNGETNDIVTHTEYTALGAVRTETDAYGRTTTYKYDESGQLTSVTDPYGNATHYQYDRLAERDSMGLPVRGNMTFTTDPDRNSTAFQYDEHGNVTTIVTGGQVDTWWYEAGSEWDYLREAYYQKYVSPLNPPGGDPAHDPFGQDGRSLTQFTYTDEGDLASTTDPYGSQRFLTQDDNGNQVGTNYTWTNPNPPQNSVELTTSRDVDANDQPTLQEGTVGGVAQPSSQTFYDVFGRAWKTVDEQGLATESTFDKRGLVIESRTQSRDATGTLVWNVTRTVYDVAGRATFVTDSYLEGTSAAEIRGTYTHYNAVGQVDYSQRIQNVNIVISGTAGNLVSTAPTGYTVISTSTTTYDGNGRTTQTTDAFGRVSQTLYDHFGNVVETRSETKDASGTTLWLVTRTVYDDLGRAICTTDPYTVAASTTLGGGDSPAVYASLTEFDARGRSVRAVRASGVVVRFDAPTQRMVRVENTGTEVSATRTVYDERARASQQIDADGQIRQTEYDARGRVSASLGMHVPVSSVGLSPVGGSNYVRLRTETRYNSLGQAYQTVTNIWEYGTVTDGVFTKTSTVTTQQRITEQVFDAQGRVVKTILPDGSSTQTEYDAYGRVSAEIDALNQRRDLQYDASGRLSQVQLPAVPDPLNNNVSTRPTYLYEYNAQGQMTKLTDALGHITTFGFNSQAQSTSRTLPSTASESFSYDARGRLEHTVSFEGVVTAYVSDDSAGGAGRLSEKRYWPSVTAYNNGAGTPSEIIQYTYDAFGREVRSECRPGGLEGYWKVDETSGTVAADSSGHGHNATLINGASWSAGGPFDGAIALNGTNQYLSVPDTGDASLEYTGGALTLSAWVYVNATDTTGGYVISKAWNSNGQYNYRLSLTSTRTVSFSLQGATSSSLTTTGSLSAAAWHHVAATVDAAGSMKIYVDGSLVSSGTHTITNWTPANGDQNKALAIGTLYPYGSGSWSYPTHALDGKLDDVRLYRRTLSADEVLAAMTAPPRIEVKTYTALGQLESVTSPEGTIHYEYDPVTGRHTRTCAGNPGATASTALSDITYTYDPLGRLATVNTVKRDGTVLDTNPGLAGNQPETSTFHYDLLGRPDYSELPNDLVEDFTFDNLDRLDVMRQYVSDADNANLTDNAIRALYDYTYRADGKRTELNETFQLSSSGQRTTDYAWDYDAAGRLTSETLDSSDNTLDQTESYILDLVGNRLRRTIDKPNPADDRTDVYSFDTSDRLLTEQRYANLTGTGTPIQTTNYTWNGTQQASKAVAIPSTSTVTQTMSYGLTGQLERVITETKNGSNQVTARTQVEYRYDASGLRCVAVDSSDSNLGTLGIERVENGRTEYLLDHYNATGYGQTLIETVKNNSNQATQRTSYTFGADEITQTVSTLHPTTGIVQTTATHTFGHDGHGSVRVLFDAAAAVSQVFTYSAYGEFLAIHNGAGVRTSGSAAALANPGDALTKQLYNGENLDPRTGLYNFRARWYAAVAGRFERLDPYAGNPLDPFSFHKYGFVHGNPVMGVDPNGQFFTIVGFLAQFAPQMQTRAEDSSTSVSTVNTAYRLQKLVNTYQKVMKLYDRVSSVIDWAEDIVDILTFDPGDVADIVNQLTANGLTRLAAFAVPTRPISVDIKLPAAARKKFGELADRVFQIKGTSTYGKILASEIAAELGTALLINLLGFKQTPFQWMWSLRNGPDQMARHEYVGAWGVFEAKGGCSPLGNSEWGPQMEGGWLEHWMNVVIDNYGHTNMGGDLKNAFNSGTPMLAAVVRVDLPSGVFKISAQAYRPPRRIGSWGSA